MNLAKNISKLYVVIDNSMDGVKSKSIVGDLMRAGKVTQVHTMPCPIFREGSSLREFGLDALYNEVRKQLLDGDSVAVACSKQDVEHVEKIKSLESIANGFEIVTI